jgi:purine-nucleoside phosphorylase
VAFLQTAGISRVILTNAAGSLNRRIRPGGWMMVSDHLNLTGKSPLTGSPHFLDLSNLYSSRLREAFGAAAKATGLDLPEGVYAAVHGPQYETPAEIRMLGILGADVVGMSTVLEAIKAHSLGLEVAALSCITNWAAGLSGQKLDHEEVISCGHASVATLALLLDAAISGIETV